MFRHLLMLLCWVGIVGAAQAQDLQPVLQAHAEEIAKPSRSSVSVALDDLAASGAPQVSVFLEQWQDKGVWQREADGVFFFGTETGDDLTLRDIDTGAESSAPTSGFSQLKPNGGVRRLIGDGFGAIPANRSRSCAPPKRCRFHRPPTRGRPACPLRASIEAEPDAALKARKIQLTNFLSASFGDTPEERIAAITSMATDTSIEARAVMNQILSTKTATPSQTPSGNVARVLTPGDDLSQADAYAQLVAAGLAPTIISAAAIREALAAHVVGGRVGGIPTAQLDTDAGRAEGLCRTCRRRHRAATCDRAGPAKRRGGHELLRGV